MFSDNNLGADAAIREHLQQQCMLPPAVDV